MLECSQLLPRENEPDLFHSNAFPLLQDIFDLKDLEQRLGKGGGGLHKVTP